MKATKAYHYISTPMAIFRKTEEMEYLNTAQRMQNSAANLKRVGNLVKLKKSL